MIPRKEHDGIRAIQEWIATASDKEIAELAAFLNTTILPADKRRRAIKNALGIGGDGK